VTSALDNQLHHAVRYDACGAVTSLLALNANPTSYTTGGLTAVMLAAEHSRLDIVQLLLAANVEPSQCDKHGSPAWFHAAGPNQIAVMAALGKQYDPTDYADSGHQPSTYSTPL
jgi:ankyrin repeat protein